MSSGNPQPTGFPHFDLLSSELQLRIIGHLVQKADILSAVRVNKYLYHLCLGLLYRDLQWTNPAVCAGIIRQAEIQRRVVPLPGQLGLAQGNLLPQIPTAFFSIPRCVLLSLTHSTRKPKEYNPFPKAYPFVVDVGGLLEPASPEAREYMKDKLGVGRDGDLGPGSSLLENTFLCVIEDTRNPLSSSNRDFEMDLTTARSIMETMDLDLHIDSLYPYWDTLVSLPSRILHPGPRENKFYFYTSLGLYNQILAMICKFSHLHTLVFYNSNLPPRLYDAIVSLPNLRSLVVDTCYLPPFLTPRVDEGGEDANAGVPLLMVNPTPQTPPRIPIIRNFTSLPITSLTILNLQPHSSRSYPSGSSHQAFSRAFGFLDRIQALKLASAQNLTDLTIDWDEITARYFGGVHEDQLAFHDRSSTIPIVSAFGRLAAAAFPGLDALEQAGVDPNQDSSSTRGMGSLTAISTNDFSGNPYVPPRGLTSLTLNMGYKWPVTPYTTHAEHLASRLWVYLLDSSALFSSFLKKFEDEVGNGQTSRLGLQHLQIFSSALDKESIIGMQIFKDKSDNRDLKLLDRQLRTSLFFPLHPTVLLPHLKTYMGPLHTIPSVLRRSLADRRGGLGIDIAQNLERVVIWDELWFLKATAADSWKLPPEFGAEARLAFSKAMGTNNLLHTLGLDMGSTNVGQELSTMNSPLTALRVPMMEWSEEIMFAVSEKLRGLRALEVFYSQGEISEYSLLSMGVRFLYKLQDLHTLRLWNPTSVWKHKVASEHPPAGVKSYIHPRPNLNHTTEDQVVLQDEDEEGCLELQCLAAWKQYVPALREFQLNPGVVYRRSDLSDGWTKRVIVTKGLDLGLEEVVDERESDGWRHGLHWCYWNRRDVWKRSWVRGYGLDS
ncbi:hypothetical protein BDN72DRAFT_964286 [Pluteus cervinus]|uniref:Uncharacterized protein n=1 Tax=Pluteus cervinus TaxID=181527 RepID=A0ACD3AAW8_9AGAR|nr:hypothetical protein BDN72DRAFT_964286 [Pluteus cervinus]